MLPSPPRPPPPPAGARPGRPIAATVLERLAALIRANHDVLATTESLDTGKPLRQAQADRVAARYFEFYGGAADKLHGETIPYRRRLHGLHLREPHGVTGHIIPWNYPAADRRPHASAPALAMGNACVLKPAEDACLTALRIAAARARGGAAGRRAQRRARPGRGGRRRAAGAPRHRPRLVHRLGRGRPLVQAAAADNRRAGDAGARRQVAAASSSPTPTSTARAADHRQRRSSRTPGQTCSAGVAPAGAAARPRRACVELLARALRARCGSARRRATWTSAR